MKNNAKVCHARPDIIACEHLQPSTHERSKLLILITLLISLAVSLTQTGCIGLTGAKSAPGNSNTAASDLAPSISTQPANQTVTAGQTATFSVGAAGTAPLTYQWSKNGAA